jgi:hypothetical protein
MLGINDPTRDQLLTKNIGITRIKDLLITVVIPTITILVSIADLFMI